MVDFIIGLILLAIVLMFGSRLISSFAEANRRPVAGRSSSPSPKDFTESGGYQPSPPARREPPNRSRRTGRAEEEAPTILSRSAAAPSDAGSTRTTDAGSVKRALANRESLRTAILLREILDPPISMKDHR